VDGKDGALGLAHLPGDFAPERSEVLIGLVTGGLIASQLGGNLAMLEPFPFRVDKHLIEAVGCPHGYAW
jgi:hypothetical protein